MTTPRSTRVRRALLVAPFLAAGLIAPAVTAPAQAAAPQTTATATVTAAAPAISPICRTKLPKEAGDTIGLIDKGGPYPYPKDGTVFQNREGLLPKKERGFYREYTVKTPGVSHRGARRIVTSGSEGHDGMYWTKDHYKTFFDIDFRC